MHLSVSPPPSDEGGGCRRQTEGEKSPTTTNRRPSTPVLFICIHTGACAGPAYRAGTDASRTRSGFPIRPRRAPHPPIRRGRPGSGCVPAGIPPGDGSNRGFQTGARSAGFRSRIRAETAASGDMSCFSLLRRARSPAIIPMHSAVRRCGIDEKKEMCYNISSDYPETEIYP